MSFGDTVTRPRRRRLRRSPIRPSRARVLHRDILGAFADSALERRLASVLLVSPWISDELGGCVDFGRVMAWTFASRARMSVVTRLPTTDTHRRALDEVVLAGGRAWLVDDLHAKVFVAEFVDGARVAYVGSANFTANSAKLLEVAVELRSPAQDPRPGVIDDLMSGPIRTMLSRSDLRPYSVTDTKTNPQTVPQLRRSR